MKLSACIEMLFVDEVPEFADRIRAAASAGASAVEFWTWRDKDLAAIDAALRETGLRLASFVSEPAGRLVDPTTHDTFLAGLEASLEVARRFGTERLIVLSGDALPGRPRHDQREALIAALRDAARMAEGAGVTLCLEPLNTRHDHPGYFLEHTDEGLDVIRAVGSDGVKLLYDLYHSVMMDEEPEAVLAEGLDLVGHVHIADAPGRHEPGTGTIDWTRRLRWLRAHGYEGYLGLEYRPIGPSAATISAVHDLARAGGSAA